MLGRPSTNPPEESAYILRAIKDNTVDGLIVIDSVGSILSFNKACESIFGYTSDDVKGRNIRMLMPDPYQGEHDGYLRRYAETGTAKIIGIGREVEGMRKNGETVPLELSVAKVELNDEVFYSGILRDISERRQAEAQIAATNAELERFVYIASHDLKEPLRTIEAFSDIIVEDYADELPAQAKEYLGYISDASARLKNLISDILNYSRMDAEDVPYETFSAREQVDIAIEGLKEAVRETGTEIHITDLPQIKAHPIRFSSLIHNLVINAIKYRDKVRPPVVKISSYIEDGEHVFCVEDNGIGISEEYHKQIFDMFRRLHGRQEYSGNGIGLAICKKIVSGWNGKIWIASQEGEGSRFYFSVPV